MMVSTWLDSTFTSTTPTPLRIVVAPGSDVAVLLKSPMELDLCYLYTPVVNGVYLYPNGTTNNNRYRQHGRGLAQQECGYLLSNVQQRDAGVWSWFARRSDGNWKLTAQSTIVVVLSAPVGDPILELSDLQSLRAGSILLATCRSPPSAPPANLTWLLDGHVVRRDQSNNTLLEDVASACPWEPQPVVQTFTYNLLTVDMGKRLECRMDHVALSSPKSIALVLPGSSATAEAGCSALATTSVNASCTMKGIAIDCSVAPVPLGTTASLACRQGYVPQINKPGVRVTTCGAKKQWRPRPLACELDCGLRMESFSLRSVGGTEARSAEFPWHVAVFQKNNNSYDPICGGSLITLEFFISAAHCFWNETTKKPVNESEYKAAAGKSSLPWKTKDDLEQRRNVRAIHIPEHYGGFSKLLESDIAVVQLSTPVTSTLAVGQVCLDWSTSFENQQLTTNNMGLVPGWGITEDNTMSPTLRYVDLPFVSYQDCHSSVPEDFTKFLLRDKFCGGYRNRSTSVCGGDSGGGFVFPATKLAEDRYFLRGVVSGAPRQTENSLLICNAEHMTSFTKISFFLDWLRDIVFTNFTGN